jgi:predicted TIM-barrel fold metal-dependent hydrolase
MKPPTHSLLFTTALTLLLAQSSAAAPGPAEAAPAFEAMLKVDAHSHMFEDDPAFHALFRRLNIQTVNICVNVGGKHLERMHEIAFDLYRQHPQLYPVISTFTLQGCDEPGYTEKVNATLGQTFERGALGVKIWKEIGLVLKRPDGSFRMPDDALWDPIYAYIAKSEKVLYAHLAEPLEAWLPLDKDSPHYHYYSRQKQFHFYGKPEIPSHESIMVARDRIMEKHPTLVVVGAHVGSLEHDLDALARRLDRYPNFYAEVSARTKTLARQPSEKVRAFLIKYQDRVLYGLDAGWQPYFNALPPTEERRNDHLQLLEKSYREDYAYYAGTGQVSHLGRQVEALHLPRSVLEKFYHQNAERVFRLKEAWERKPAATARP